MIADCRYFSGYKPCGKSLECNENCKSLDRPQLRLLIVHLGALGAVLRATSLVPAIKRKYPSSHITWVTDAPAHHFFQGNQFVDRVLTTSEADLLSISSLSFDIAFCLDKSLKAGGVLARCEYDLLLGFTVDPRTGAILPANKEANELWQIGLNDELKFKINKKPETQLMTEALDLKWQRDKYQVFLSETELIESKKRRDAWSQAESKGLLGINTGSAPIIPYKKLPIEKQRNLIIKVQNRFPELQIVLLGGPEDSMRNSQIAEGLGVIQSQTDKGLRDGLISMQAIDLLITGDSLGMHMGIALEKWVIAWFGATCSHEIDLYGKGEALLAPVACGPCWKRQCDLEVRCNDLITEEAFLDAIDNYLSLPEAKNNVLNILDVQI